MLNHIVVGSAAGLGLETVLATTCRELAQTLGLHQARAVLFNDSQTEGRVVAECLAETGHQPNLTPSDETIPLTDDEAYRHILRHKTMLVVNNARVPGELELISVHNMLLGQGISSLLLLPLLAGGQVRGALYAASPEPHHFSEEELNLARVVADHLSDVVAQTRPD